MVANYDDTNGDRSGGLRLVHSAGDGRGTERSVVGNGGTIGRGEQRGARGRLLVVSDLTFLRQALTLVLGEKLGLKAEMGSGWTTEAQRHDPEGQGLNVVVDLAAHGDDGTHRVSTLRKSNRGAAILVLVSKRGHSRTRLLRAGADEVLGKDASVDEIVHTVKRMATSGM